MELPRRHLAQLCHETIYQVVNVLALDQIAVVFCSHLEEEAAGEGDHGVQVVGHAYESGTHVWVG